MSYIKRRLSSESLELGTVEGKYLMLRPNTELRNSGDEKGQEMTRASRASLNIFMFGGLKEEQPKVNAFGTPV